MHQEQTDSLLNSYEVANLLGLRNPGTLANWRNRQCGPPYFRVGSRVRYRLSDLQEWLNERKITFPGGQHLQFKYDKAM